MTKEKAIIKNYNYLTFIVTEPEDLGELVSDARRKWGMSIAKVSRMSKLSPYTIRSIESGRIKNIANRDLEYLCRLLIIDYRIALECTNCSGKLINELLGEE